MKRIGILGGMGPQATLDLYQRIIDLTPVNTDQEHIPVLIDSYPQIEDRTAFILGKGPDPTNKLIESAQRLEKGGAQAIIMACNTAHYFADSIQNAINIPLLHIAEATLSNLKKSFPPFTKIAVLATDGTQKAGIYKNVLEANQYQVAAITAEQQKTIMEIIYQGAKRGQIRQYANTLQRLIEKIPADIFLLACTELPLFLPYISATNKQLIDPTEILAKAAIDFALDI